MKVIDCHVHLNGYQESEPFSIEGVLKKLLRYMDIYDVECAIVLSSYKVTSHRPSAERLLKIAEKYENLKIVAGYAIENHTSSDFRKLRRWLKEEKLIGIKIYCGYEPHYPSDQGYKKIYDLCVEFNAPVMIHCGDTFARNAKLKYSHPLNVDEIATDNPELKIVICHLGNPWILDCQEVLYKNQNVHADISGLFYGPSDQYYEQCLVRKIKELLSYTSHPHHLIFGTDWPISDSKLCFRLVDKLSLSKEDLHLLMYGNVQKLFNL
jgi:uncharacterized protein